MNDAGRGHPREGLSDYLDDQLTVEARAGIDRHLAECEECRTELEALSRLKRAVADEQVPPVPLDLHARIGRSLDAEAGARPRRRRFVIPTTIAATIAALGILVVIQWREGRIAVPPPPRPALQSKGEARDELLRQSAPLPQAPVAPEHTGAFHQKVSEEKPREPKENERRDLLDKDLNQAPASTLAPIEKQKSDERELKSVPSLAPPPAAAAGDTEVDAARERAASKVAAPAPTEVPGGVANGVVGGVVGGVQGGVAGGVPGRSSRCAEHWSDSGLRGRWEVPDVDAAAKELGRVAADVGGTTEWRGAADGRPFVLIVPRDHFDEVFYALRARGVTGLDAPTSLADVAGCPGITVTLVAVPAAPSPTPR